MSSMHATFDWCRPFRLHLHQISNARVGRSNKQHNEPLSWKRSSCHIHGSTACSISAKLQINRYLLST